MNFEEFNLKTLREIIKKYKLHYIDDFKGFSKLKKDKLIEKIKNHLYIDGDLIKYKNKNFEMKKPFTKTKKRIEKEKKEGEKIKAFFKEQLKDKDLNIKPLEAHAVKKEVVKKVKVKKDKTKKEKKDETKKIKEAESKAEDKLKNATSMEALGETQKKTEKEFKKMKGKGKKKMAIDDLRKMENNKGFSWGENEDRIIRFANRYPELELTESNIAGLFDKKKTMKSIYEFVFERIMEKLKDDEIEGKGYSDLAKSVIKREAAYNVSQRLIDRLSEIDEELKTVPEHRGAFINPKRRKLEREYLDLTEKLRVLNERYQRHSQNINILGEGRKKKIDGVALHAIIINKRMPFEEAKKKALEISNKKKIFHRETKDSFRFRNIPKTKFEKKSYKSKKIDKDITLVFGKLKPEFLHLEGKGFFDFIKKGVEKVKEVFKPKFDYNNSSKKALLKFGNNKITGLQIVRTPINNMLNKVLDFISMGKFSEAKKKYNYDDLFHLGLLVEVDGMKKVLIEKNEVINISPNFKQTDKTDFLNINLGGKQLSINQLLENTKKKIGNDRFFIYDAFGGKNCQNFIKDILSSNNLLTNEAEKFLFQPINDLVKELPSYVPAISKGVTDFASYINRISGGKIKGGRMSEQYKKYAERRKKDLIYMAKLKEENPEEFQKELEKRFKEHEDRINQIKYELSPEGKRELYERLYQEYLKEHPDKAFFEKLVKGLTDVGDFLVENVAEKIGVPKVVTEAYKTFAPPGSKYYKQGTIAEKAIGKLTGGGFNRIIKDIITELGKVFKQDTIDYYPDMITRSNGLAHYLETGREVDDFYFKNPDRIIKMFGELLMPTQYRLLNELIERIYSLPTRSLKTKFKDFFSGTKTETQYTNQKRLLASYAINYLLQLSKKVGEKIFENYPERDRTQAKNHYASIIMSFINEDPELVKEVEIQRDAPIQTEKLELMKQMELLDIQNEEGKIKEGEYLTKANELLAKMKALEGRGKRKLKTLISKGKKL